MPSGLPVRLVELQHRAIGCFTQGRLRRTANIVVGVRRESRLDACEIQEPIGNAAQCAHDIVGPLPATGCTC